jgi:hypothetical protein
MAPISLTLVACTHVPWRCEVWGAHLSRGGRLCAEQILSSEGKTEGLCHFVSQEEWPRAVLVEV